MVSMTDKTIKKSLDGVTSHLTDVDTKRCGDDGEWVCKAVRSEFSARTLRFSLLRYSCQVKLINFNIRLTEHERHIFALHQIQASFCCCWM